jgi:acetyltransferase-like isoleucine patch superfamily enzyme
MELKIARVFPRRIIDGKPGSVGSSGTFRRLLKPIAKRLIYSTLQPLGPAKHVLLGFARVGFYTREAFEWGRRSVVATPVFLSQCATYGDNISVDRVPYINGTPRIELGSNIRVSGLINIAASSKGTPTLVIGDGVFIGHGTSFAVATRISVGKYASIAGGCYIADTEGHSHYNPQKPIWEVPAGEGDVAPVTIEDGVQISRNVMILKGVTIGARSVIGAGSVVRSDIPPDSIVMGNPARVVKKMTP